MNMPKLVADLLDRLERANRQIATIVAKQQVAERIAEPDKNHPDLVKARAEVIELQALVRERDEQIVGLKAGASGWPARIVELEAEKRTMAGIISGLRVWQIAAKNLLTKRKVAKRLWPKEPKATA